MVLGPTLARGLFGVGVPTPEDQAKYQGWGDMDGALPDRPAGKAPKEDASKGKSL